MKWYAGSDHAGIKLKNALIQALQDLGDEVVDVGCHGPESVDYPDFAQTVAQKVAAENTMGLLVCGTGIGMAISANKMPGIRAALIHSAYTAQSARSHNNANIAVLGERVVGQGEALSALQTFRDTPFTGDRHARRVEKMMALEDS